MNSVNSSKTPFAPPPQPSAPFRGPNPAAFLSPTYATMSRNPDMPRREVSETVLELLHAEIVTYFLRGHGAHAFVPPIPEKNEEKVEEKGEEKDEENDGTLPLTPLQTEEEEVLVAKRCRLEALGQDVGGRLVERYVVDRDRLDHNLDMVKFICKDFWEHAFRKQIDVLRTNHRGLYVLTDNDFRWLRSVSRDGEHPGMFEDYVVLACGLICGALTRLGIKCRVSAKLVPQAIGRQCSFNLQVIQN